MQIHSNQVITHDKLFTADEFGADEHIALKIMEALKFK